MRKLCYTIPKGSAGRTVQEYLKGEHGYSTRTLIKLKALPLGLTVNGKHVRTVDRLKEGDTLCCALEDAPAALALSAREVPLLYADDDLLVYDKPPAMPCHPSNGHYDDTLANVYAARCARLGVPGAFRALNRLDADTTGCVLVACNQHVAARLTRRFDKVYVALVCGELPTSQGEIDAPILRRDQEHKRDITRIVHPQGQRAITRYTRLAVGSGYSLVQFALLTGRTHQIRVHMAYLGYPLAGDSLYGGDCALIGRQALHCSQVSFCHPVSGRDMTVDAPLPADLCAALSAAGLSPVSWEK